MRERKQRVHGPYQHGQRFRLYLVDVDGERGMETFASEAAALDRREELLGEVDGHTLTGAVDAYLAHLRERGRKADSVTTVRYRLHGLLRVVERDRPLRALTAELARELWARRCAEVGADTQVGELAAARGFTSWCAAQGWLRGDPLAGLEPTGARARGKAQLRIDEARRFVRVALDEGTPAGVAAAIALLMGLRATEVTGRVVRDVDDGARVLWIERAKTRRGDRRLEVPEVLRARLAALVAGRRATERLFGDVDRHWLGYHVRRLCRAAKVPELGPQSLRGTQSSIAAGAVSVEHVAAALGHRPAVTRRHYLARGAEQDGQQRAALRVLQGGRR